MMQRSAGCILGVDRSKVNMITSAGRNHHTDFVLRRPGWAMQVACFVFIQRRWAEDKQHIENMLDYFCDIREPLQLLLFPEGTDLTGEKETMQHPQLSLHRFQLLFSELDTQQHLFCTFALLCKCDFQMLQQCQILPGTIRQSFLKML